MKIGVRQAANLLDISEKTIYRWIKEKKLPSHRIGGQYRFTQGEIIEWAIEQGVNIPQNLSEEQNGTEASLYEGLRKGGIFYRIDGNDIPSVLKNVIAIIPLPEIIDRDFLFQVLLARETMGSTGIGDGIAIPHARNPIIQHLTDPIVSLSFLENPVDFHAIDGKPVHTLFIISSPSTMAHLQLLSKLSYILRGSEFLEAVKKRASREEIFQTALNSERSLLQLKT